MSETLVTAELVALVYELLDAHDDTALLARTDRRLEPDPFWRDHLEYLRRLQRVGRETLARHAQQEGM